MLLYDTIFRIITIKDFIYLEWGDPIMAMNVTTAVFEPDGDKIVMTDPVWQYDYGQILQFSGIE